jgi:hypothetical protein
VTRKRTRMDRRVVRGFIGSAPLTGFWVGMDACEGYPRVGGYGYAAREECDGSR